MAERRFKAVVLDLFDTLVRWEPERLPTLEWRGRSVRSTMPWLLPRIREALDGNFDLDAFLEAYYAVIEEINAQRERGLIEITCHERFVRTLGRLGLPEGENLDSAARDLRRIHMAGVRSVTSAPPEYVAAVRRVAQSHRLGLLSNFDDSQTGREILADTGVSHLFEAVIISADLAMRKPNPLIFQRMLEMLSLGPDEILFVGDTPREDVMGARNAGIPIAWLSRGKGLLPEGIPAPDFILDDLTGLPALLEP
jgi:FMN phosphatase YigB (HAD superfamily)